MYASDISSNTATMANARVTRETKNRAAEYKFVRHRSSWQARCNAAYGTMGQLRSTPIDRLRNAQSSRAAIRVMRTIKRSE